MLSPLAHVAAETHAAIVAVHHLNKGTSPNALYRASGSLDFVAAARVVHGVAPDPDNEGRRVFVPVKCNIAAMPEGLGFRIGEEGVVFDNLPVNLDAAAAFSTRSIDHEKRSELDMAKEFLQEELADGPVPASTLFTTAKGYGYSVATVRRAAKDLHVRKTKQGFQGAWRWSLPDPRGTAEASNDGRPDNVVTFVTFGDSGLDHEEGMVTFGARDADADELHQPDSPDPADVQGSKDDHGQGPSSLEAPKDDQGTRRGNFDDADPSDPDLDGDQDDLVVDHPVDSADVDEGDQPDQREGACVSDDLFCRAVEVVVAVGAASEHLIAKRCGCSPDEAAAALVALEAAGVVGGANGSKSRAVLITEDDVEGIVCAHADRGGRQEESWSADL